ncbi:hypothetical protein RIF29_39418 [Crotalaria pallida]|uniref:Uncharacterized protein n=1 Tax=Crotalaria pallida TaxID=3830 RepID=A0AAN9E140_CROPI
MIQLIERLENKLACQKFLLVLDNVRKTKKSWRRLGKKKALITHTGPRMRKTKRNFDNRARATRVWRNIMNKDAILKEKRDLPGTRTRVYNAKMT